MAEPVAGSGGRLRILTIVGTRPEAIKLAPVIRALQQEPQAEVRVCSTGQHREMLDQALGLFGIRPDYDLRAMAHDQSPAQVGAALLARIEPVLARERPHWVLVQGDTTTAALAALAAYWQRARVGHVEAGLRSFDKWQPFPEEVNRRVISAVADLHFAPTPRARDNLLAEGVPAGRVLVTGNPVIDALQWVAAQPWPPATPELPPAALGRPGERLILVTAHRRENLGAPLEQICLALRDIAARHGQGVRIVYPVHLNPNVWGPVHRLLGGLPNVVLTPPLAYLPLLEVMKRAWLVLTDSGGIQEEAPGLGKPVLVLRQVTERPEGVEAGTARLVGTERRRIVAEVERLLSDLAAYERMARAVNPYGDGHASQRIARALLSEEGL